MELKASLVKCIRDDETDVLLVGFQNESTDEYVLLQFSDELDEQDILLGWSKYYLDINNLGGDYSCIKRVEINQKNIKIYLNDRGVKKFGFDYISIIFELLEAEYDELKHNMNLIFEEENILYFT
jgi:hypothetical protein